MASTALCTLAGALVGFAAKGIEWEGSLETATQRAQAENKVVFIALNMDGERANDRLAKETYQDRSITELSQQTINLVGSTSDHGGKVCKRFGGLSCPQHRDIEGKVRKDLLRVSGGAYVIAPQHVFLAPDGTVILSVPYDLSMDELQWCFHTALAQVDPEHSLPVDSDLRPPKRLVMKGFEAPPTDPTTGGHVISRRELLALIDTAQRAEPAERRKMNWQIITADEPEAREYIRREMKTKQMNKGNAKKRRVALQKIGIFSPSSYWEVVADYIDDARPEVRREVAVALEQLAAPRSLRPLKAALKKEKDLSVKKNWLRALGTAGAVDKASRKLLLKAAASDKEPLLQVNAVIALGSTSQEPEVVDLLQAGLEDPSPEVRAAAACAMAISRRSAYLGRLKEALGGESEAKVRSTVELAIKVMQGENLRILQADVRRIAQDQLKRERLFGRN